MVGTMSGYNPADYIPPDFFVDNDNFVVIDEYHNLKKPGKTKTWVDVKHWAVLEDVYIYNPYPDDAPFPPGYFAWLRTSRGDAVVIAGPTIPHLDIQRVITVIFAVLYPPRGRLAHKSVPSWLVSVLDSFGIDVEKSCYRASTGRWHCYSSDELRRYAMARWPRLRQKLMDVARTLRHIVVDDRMLRYGLDFWLTLPPQLRYYYLYHADIAEIAAVDNEAALLRPLLRLYTSEIEKLMEVVEEKIRDADVEQHLRRLYEEGRKQGKSVNDIAREAGLSPASFYQHGIVKPEKKRRKRRGYKWTTEEERIAIAKMYWCEGKKIVEIAKITGRGVGTISRIINKYRGKIKCDPSQ